MGGNADAEGTGRKKGLMGETGKWRKRGRDVRREVRTEREHEEADGNGGGPQEIECRGGKTTHGRYCSARFEEEEEQEEKELRRE